MAVTADWPHRLQTAESQRTEVQRGRKDLHNMAQLDLNVM